MQPQLVVSLVSALVARVQPRRVQLNFDPLSWRKIKTALEICDRKLASRSHKSTARSPPCFPIAPSVAVSLSAFLSIAPQANSLANNNNKTGDKIVSIVFGLGSANEREEKKFEERATSSDDI